MKGIISLFVFITGTSTAFSSAQAATADSTAIQCDYVTASTIIAYYEPKIQSTQNKGTLTLVKDGNLFKGEVVFDVFKMKVEGQFLGSDLSLTLNVLDTKYATSQKIVATMTSFHRGSDSGVFQGTAILRSPQVATLALQNDVAYETAPLEKLSTGSNFLGAYVSCL
jgi:hypothetical protein